MPAQRCPTGPHELAPLRLGQVEVDWCPACRAVWFDRGELAAAFELDGAVELTRQQPACACPACPRGRRSELWFSRLDQVPLLACLTCGGAFVTEAALKAGPRPHRWTLQATFRCAGCADRYPLSKLGGVDPLTCARCQAERPITEAPPPDLWSRLLSLFGG